MEAVTPAFWLGIVAVFAVPLFVRHFAARTEESESETVSAAWLRENR